MKTYQKTVGTILKAVGLGMAAAVLVLNIMGAVTVDAGISMLSMGLFGMAMASLQEEKK